MLLFTAATLSSFAFAGRPVDVKNQTLVSFSRDFSNVEATSWESHESYSRATFVMNGQVMYAFYDESNGKLIGTSRFLHISQMPLALQDGLKKTLKDHWMTELFEMSTDDTTTYYATIESKTEIRVLKSDGFSGWSVSSVTKKH